MVTYGKMDSPIGRLWLAATGTGLCRIGLPDESEEAFLAWIEQEFGPQIAAEGDAALAATVIQLREYFSRLRQTFEIPLDLRGTSFQTAVWGELRKVPYGTTITYGDLAQRLGRPASSARAIGGALRVNPVPIVVPCHRVIGADGSLVGYSGGLDIKVALLRLEGIQRKGPVESREIGSSQTV